MDADDISTCTGKFLDMVFRIGDHQVAIKNQLAMWTHALYDTSSKADIGHKMAIHDIDMGIVSSSCF